jgi:plasmid stabilization system protein ParE
MIPIVKSPQYEQDLAEIWQHIAQSNPTAADRVVTAIENAIELLSEFPGIGAPAHIWRQSCAARFGGSIRFTIGSRKIG